MKVEGKTRTQTNCPRILRCAWAHCGRMERLVRVPYSLYPGYGNTLPLGQPGLSEHKQPDWRHNNGPPAFLARPGLLVPSNASDYCVDPYKRAQLKAILSQMNPSLSLRLCKADTKEVGVQVNPRVDKSVQCSLGPRTLHSRSPWGSTGYKASLSAWEVYSPVMGRRGLVRLQKDGEDEERKALSGPPEASQPPPLPPPTPGSEENQREELRQQEELGEEDASSPRERKSKQAQGDASEPLRKPNFQVSFLFPHLSPLFPFFPFLVQREQNLLCKHIFYMSYVYVCVFNFLVKWGANFKPMKAQSLGTIAIGNETKKGFRFVKSVIRSSFCAGGANGLGENRLEKRESS